MRPDGLLDDEPITPAGEDGIARMYRLAFVCVLCLIAGGAAAFALYQSRQGAAEVRGVVEQSPYAERNAGAEAAAVEGAAGEDTSSGGGEDLAAGDVAADEVEDGMGVSARGARSSRARVRVRAEAGESAGHDFTVSSRRYARASGRQVAAGGRGVGGYALGGVKKTGEGVKKTGTAIGKTVGKIGGIFHD